MCNKGVSLGKIISEGFGLLPPNSLDSDFLQNIHVGSLSPKSIVDGVKDGKWSPEL